MHLVYVSNVSILSGGGGAELRTDEVSEHLAKMDHETTVLCGKTAPDLPTKTVSKGRNIRHISCIPEFLFKFENVSYYLSRYLFPIFSLPILLHIVYSKDVDVVVESASPYPTLAIVAKWLLDVNTVIVQHGFFDKKFYQQYDPVTVSIQLVVQNFLRLFAYDRVIVPSNHIKYQLIDYGVPTQKIRVISNGVDYSLFQQDTDSPPEPKLISVGRITKIKGQETLIRAFREIQQQLPNATLDIVGKGPRLSHLKEISSRYGLNDSVTFHGYVTEEDKVDLLNRSDIFLYGSEYESFGIVMLEAMAAGLPIVAVEQPAYSDFFQTGQNGFLVDSQDDQDIANKTIRILNSRECIEAISRANRNKAQSHTWRSVAEKTETILLECI